MNMNMKDKESRFQTRKACTITKHNIKTNPRKFGRTISPKKEQFVVTHQYTIV